MTSNSEASIPFKMNINNAINFLKARNYIVAEDFIKYAMLEDSQAPEPHNLLGTLAELTGDLSLARKHYRVAITLDPTYKPASKNLDRITSFYYSFKNPDFGDMQEEVSNAYFMEYDENNIGHVIKRSK